MWPRLPRGGAGRRTSAVRADQLREEQPAQAGLVPTMTHGHGRNVLALRTFTIREATPRAPGVARGGDRAGGLCLERVGRPPIGVASKQVHALPSGSVSRGGWESLKRRLRVRRWLSTQYRQLDRVAFRHGGSAQVGSRRPERSRPRHLDRGRLVIPGTRSPRRLTADTPSESPRRGGM